MYIRVYGYLSSYLHNYTNLHMPTYLRTYLQHLPTYLSQQSSAQAIMPWVHFVGFDLRIPRRVLERPSIYLLSWKDPNSECPWPGIATLDTRRHQAVLSCAVCNCCNEGPPRFRRRLDVWRWMVRDTGVHINAVRLPAAREHKRV